MNSNYYLDPEHWRMVDELKKRGAKTFGRSQRIRERLDRFIKFEQKKALAEKRATWKRTRSAERDIRRSEDEQYRQMVNEAFPGVLMPSDKLRETVTPTYVLKPPPGGEPEEYEPMVEQEYTFCSPILVVVIAVMGIHLVAGAFTLALWVGGQNGFSIDQTVDTIYS